MSIAIKSLGPNVLELDIHGKLEARDYKKFTPMAEERIREHGRAALGARSVRREEGLRVKRRPSELRG